MSGRNEPIVLLRRIRIAWMRAIAVFYWMVLKINTLMFCVEVGAGLAAVSASLQADALDFLGDAGNYVISLAWSYATAP